MGESPPTDQFEYTLKIINPSRMSDFKNVDIHAKSYCSSLDELRKFIASKLPATVDPPDMEAVDMGFIEPGMEGRVGKCGFLVMRISKQCIRHSKEKREFCYGATHRALHKERHKNLQNLQKKKETSESTKKTKSTYETQLKRQEEVEKIFHELEEKHSGKYKVEQLRTWAHMYHLKTHDSLDIPPDKPFFRGNVKKRPSSLTSSGERTPESKRAAVTTRAGVSPGRRVNIRSELIDQLKKCQDLVDTGAISKEIFEDLQHYSG